MSGVLMVKSCQRELSQAKVVNPLLLLPPISLYPIKPAVQAVVASWPSHQLTLPCRTLAVVCGGALCLVNLRHPIANSAVRIPCVGLPPHNTINHTLPCAPLVSHLNPTLYLALHVPMQDATSPTNGLSFPGLQGSSRQ